MDSKVVRIKTDLLEKIAEKNVNINDFIELSLKEPTPNVSENERVTTEKVVAIPKCPSCGEVDRICKNGYAYRRSGKWQRHLCSNCGYQFIGELLVPFPKKAGE